MADKVLGILRPRVSQSLGDDSTFSGPWMYPCSQRQEGGMMVKSGGNLTVARERNELVRRMIELVWLEGRERGKKEGRREGRRKGGREEEVRKREKVSFPLSM